MGFTVVADCGIVSIIIIIIIISDFILHTNCIVIESRVSGIFSFNHYPSLLCLHRFSKDWTVVTFILLTEVIINPSNVRVLFSFPSYSFVTFSPFLTLYFSDRLCRFLQVPLLILLINLFFRTAVVVAVYFLKCRRKFFFIFTISDYHNFDLVSGTFSRNNLL
jgi:hypothetical protein